MGVLKEQNLGILVDAINRNVNTKINAIKGSNNATDVNMSDGTTVEVAVNKNKNDITAINTYLNKSENTKYQTVDGVKEFECKDGYIDNIVIEGKTLVNLWGVNGFGINGDNVTIFEDGRIKHTSKANRFSNFFDFNLDMLETNTDYTVIVFVYVNEFMNGKIHINNPDRDVEGAFTTPIIIEPDETGIFINKIRTRDSFAGLTGTYPNTGLRSYFDNVAGEIGKRVELQILMLKGDHTQKPPGYFERLASVGQGDKIEILSRKHGSNLYNNSVIYGKSIRESGVIVDNAEWCIIDSLYVEKNKTYTIEKGSSSGVGDNIGYIYVYEFNFDGSYSNKRHDLGLENNTFTPSKNCLIKISIKYTKIEGFGVFDSDLKLPYSTDKKQILTTLRSLPNGVKDTIEKRGNKYYKIQRVIEVDVYDTIKKYNLEVVIEKENETTSKPIIKNFVTTLGGGVDGNNFNVYCSHFKVHNIYQDTITKEGIYLTTHMHNRILKSKVVGLQGIVSKNAMLAWYRKNKVKVAFELAEPIVTELPNLNLRTFSPQTTLVINSGAVQSDIPFDVINTLYNKVDVMVDKIDSLENMLSGQFEIGTESINNLLKKING